MDKKITEIFELVFINAICITLNKPQDKRVKNLVISSSEEDTINECVERSLYCIYRLMKILKCNNLIDQLIVEISELTSFRFSTPTGIRMFQKETRKLLGKKKHQPKKGRFTKDDELDLKSMQHLSTRDYCLEVIEPRSKMHIHQLLVNLDNHISSNMKVKCNKKEYRFYLLYLFYHLGAIDFFHKGLDPNRKFQEFRKNVAILEK